MRLGQKLKKGLKFGLKLGAGALAIGGAIALGSKTAPAGQSGGGGAVAPEQLPSVPKPKSDTRKEIDHNQYLEHQNKDNKQYNQQMIL